MTIVKCVLRQLHRISSTMSMLNTLSKRILSTTIHGGPKKVCSWPRIFEEIISQLNTYTVYKNAFTMFYALLCCDWLVLDLRAGCNPTNLNVINSRQTKFGYQLDFSSNFYASTIHFYYVFSRRFWHQLCTDIINCVAAIMTQSVVVQSK